MENVFSLAKPAAFSHYFGRRWIFLFANYPFVRRPFFSRREAEKGMTHTLRTPRISASRQSGFDFDACAPAREPLSPRPPVEIRPRFFTTASFSSSNLPFFSFPIWMRGRRGRMPPSEGEKKGDGRIKCTEMLPCHKQHC